jgi:hypothetical protein
MWMVGNIPFAISFTSYLADIILAQGYLREAISVYGDRVEPLHGVAGGRGDVGDPGAHRAGADHGDGSKLGGGAGGHRANVSERPRGAHRAG